MAVLRLFGPARDIAGRAADEIPATSVAEITKLAADRYGERFSELLVTCRIWVNGEQADERTLLGDEDEVAVLPPVSGG